MGEILRAICDASALYAQTAFYCAAPISQVTPGTGRVYARRTTAIQCKTDTWFLMMGWNMNTSGVAAGSQGNWLPKAAPNAFTVQDGRTSELLSWPLIVPKVNQGYNLNNIVWLPEYYLWPPSSLIVFLEDIEIASGNAITQNNYVTLTGIEYRMPDSFGR